MNKSTSSRALQTATGNTTFAPSGILQRKCARCGTHTVAGNKCDECQKGALQRKPSNSSEQTEVPPVVNEVLNLSGQSLDSKMRSHFESHFGYDFSNVRIHTDAKASESAQSVNALAYTVGRDIVFGAGQYTPNTPTGQGLLAHELTHVIQAGSSLRGSNIKIGRADSAQEQAAEHNEITAHPVVSHSAANLLQRKKGGSVGGFFANIGRAFADLIVGKEPGYDDTTLDKYLEYLRENKDIEDDFDSDNKARAVVSSGKFRSESTEIKTLLVDEMLSGAAFDDDERAILFLLEAVGVDERGKIATKVTYAKLYNKFNGEELDLLYGLLPNMERFYPRSGKEHNAYSFQDYIKKWENEHGRSMTAEERNTLAAGCIGITSLNLGLTGKPPLSRCYGSFEQAWNVAQTMNQFIRDKGYKDKKAIIFSKRFWAGENDYTPDPKTGQVDMTNYTYDPKPGYVNFDYGFYDEQTNKWWHANHCEPSIRGPRCGNDSMEAYESSLPYYSRSLLDFNEQVFCVAVSTLK